MENITVINHTYTLCMATGVEYECYINTNTKDFVIKYVFGDGTRKILSHHKTVYGLNVVCVGDYVTGIEFSF